MKIKSKEFYTQIEPVQRQLEGWRRTRKNRERIPESLWSAMAKLAGSYGVSRVCQALRVEYPALKRRVHGVEVARPEDQVASFVELKVPAAVQASGCVVEVEDRSGAKMTLRLAQGSSADVLGFVQAFWRRGA